MANPWLFADLDDWIRIGVIIIFVIGPLLSQLGKNPKGDGRGAKGAKPPAQPQANPRKGLAAEIERILSQAQQAAAEAKKQAAAERKGPPLATKPEARQPIAPEGTPRPPRRRGPLASDVSKHVQEHIQSRPVSDHAKTLAKRIEQADEKVEQRLQEKFGHRLGDLEAGMPSATPATKEFILQGTDSADWQGLADAKAKAEEVASTRQEFIRTMFQDREQLRNAFVLAEIIGRPRADDLV
jgi:hypothetical protein